MFELRPHHLLCTQGYSGKGYNDEFVENMNFVVDKLRNVPGTKVNLVCNTDVLCSKCVNKLDENQCLTQDKVAEFDRKTLEVFGLEETEYVYSEVVEHINVIQHFLFPNYCNSTAHYFRLFSHHGLSNVHFFAAHYFLILLVDIFNVTKKRERTSPTTASSFSHTQVLQAVPKQDRVLNNTAICLQAVTYINYDKKKLTIYQAF